LEKKGSDKYMVQVLEDGNRGAMLQAYLELHHTNPDEATLKRARGVFFNEGEELEAVRGLRVYQISGGGLA
jgi:hypothetical protein